MTKQELSEINAKVQKGGDILTLIQDKEEELIKVNEMINQLHSKSWTNTKVQIDSYSASFYIENYLIINLLESHKEELEKSILELNEEFDYL